MEAGQQPKYLNSPETPIYVKGRTLYGLHLSKAAIARAKHAVMVEGYFDVAQALQAGITNVVASSGTALTPAQAQAVETFRRRKSSSASIPTRPARGRRPGRRSCWSPRGSRSTSRCCRRATIPITSSGRTAGRRTRSSCGIRGRIWTTCSTARRPDYDFSKDESRREFLNAMLEVAARIPDAAARDQFADRLAHKARITEEVVRAEIRKAAVQQQTTVRGADSCPRSGR